MSLPLRTNLIILAAAASTAGIGVGGAFAGPHADLAGIIAIWVGLLIALSKDAGQPMSKDKALKIVTSVASGVLLALAGIKAGATVFAWTGVGTVPAVIGNCGLNAGVTYIFGRAVAETFRNKDHFDSIEQLAKHLLATVLSTIGLSGSDQNGPDSHA